MLADLSLKTPEPRISDLGSFESYLKESSIDPSLYLHFMRAAENRYAWKSGDLEEWQGLEALVDNYWDTLGTRGLCAWCGPRGETVYCAWGAHGRVARVFFGLEEEGMEKSWAKVTWQSDFLPEDAIAYVARPTKAMRRAVLDVLGNRDNV